MRKTGVLILVLLVLGVVASCAKENQGPAEPEKEVLAGSSEAAAVNQAAVGTEDSEAGSQEAGAPRITFDQKDFDFGEVETGVKIEHVYKFRNTGDGTLEIHKVRSG
jgi:hypothetical protein